MYDHCSGIREIRLLIFYIFYSNILCLTKSLKLFSTNTSTNWYGYQSKLRCKGTEGQDTNNIVVFFYISVYWIVVLEQVGPAAVFVARCWFTASNRLSLDSVILWPFVTPSPSRISGSPCHKFLSEKKIVSVYFSRCRFS